MQDIPLRHSSFVRHALSTLSLHSCLVMLYATPLPLAVHLIASASAFAYPIIFGVLIMNVQVIDTTLYAQCTNNKYISSATHSAASHHSLARVTRNPGLASGG